MFDFLKKAFVRKCIKDTYKVKQDVLGQQLYTLRKKHKLAKLMNTDTANIPFDVYIDSDCKYYLMEVGVCFFVGSFSTTTQDKENDLGIIRKDYEELKHIVMALYWYSLYKELEYTEQYYKEIFAEIVGGNVCFRFLLRK